MRYLKYLGFYEIMTNPIVGAGYFMKGFSLLNQPGIRRYVIIPLLINISIFAILIYFAIDYFSLFLDYLLAQLPGFLSWLSWILWPIFFILSLLVFFFSFSILANFIAAPFNSYLAEAIEKSLTGKSPPGSDRPMMQEFFAVMLSELKKLLYYLVLLVPIIIISFIPLVQIITPVLWALLGAWMMSVQYSDYPMGNYGLTFTRIRNNLRDKRMLNLGFGGMVVIATMIPIVNFLVMPIAVAGATLLWVEEYLPLQDTVTDNPTQQLK